MERMLEILNINIFDPRCSQAIDGEVPHLGVKCLPEMLEQKCEHQTLVMLPERDMGLGMHTASFPDGKFWRRNYFPL